ncbi:MAG: RNA polymerase sigma factor [Gemmataceae bacterium]
MFRVSMADLVTRLRFLLRPPGPPSADADLLTRFVERHDQDAFAELVRRHGPMVYGVCRRALGDGPDAEDAYQAAFLVLARRAAAVARMRSMSGWLYGVACLTAKKARARRTRRRMQEGCPLPDVPAPLRTVEPDLGGVIDEELTAVPERYRTAVVLCELRQLTLDEAAAELGVPRGTVASRLARGRELLGRRLLRRGLFAAGVGASSATARPPVELELKVVELGTTPDTTHELTREVLHTMSGSNRFRLLALLGIAAVAVGLPFLLPSSVAAPTPKADGQVPVDRVKLNGIGGLLAQPAVRKALDLTEEQEGKLKGVEKEIMAMLKLVGQPQPGPFGREQANEKLNEALAQYDAKAAAATEEFFFRVYMESLK